MDLVNNLYLKKVVYCFLFGLLSANLLAQSPMLGWAKAIHEAEVSSIATSSDGYVYTTGRFFKTTDFDPGPGVFNLSLAPRSFNDIFIQKLDTAGNFIWAKSMGGRNHDAGVSVSIDLAGNVYTIGYFRDTVDLDPGPGVMKFVSARNNFSINFSMFIQKLDASGNLIWAKTVVGNNFLASTQPITHTTDHLGNLYILGTFTDTVDFDPGPSVANLITASSGRLNSFVLKLDASGNYVWAKSIGGFANTDNIYPNSLTVDASENVYIVGDFTGSVDFDPGIGTYNLTAKGMWKDFYIQKLDRLGNFIWTNAYGESSFDGIGSIVVSPEGYLYSTGHFSGTVDFDPGIGVFNLTSKGVYRDYFVQKMDTSGNLIWVKSMGGTGPDGGGTINADADDNLYVTGSFAGTVDFDPGAGVFNLTATGPADIFIQKLDSLGDFIWAEAIQGSGSGALISATLDDDRNLYTTGRILGKLDFDPGAQVFNLTSSSGGMFIHKLIPCTQRTTDTVVTCSEFTWIDGNTYLSSGEATHILFGEAVSGCDSMITLHLTMDILNLGVKYINDHIPTLIANESGRKYQWIDCDNNTDVFGETNQVFTPTRSGNYAVIIDGAICTDTSECIAVASVGIEKLDIFSKVSIYPNPTDGIVKVDLGGLYETDINVFNTQGQLVYFKHHSGAATHQFELNESPGIYYMELNVLGKGSEFYKLIVR